MSPKKADKGKKGGVGRAVRRKVPPLRKSGRRITAIFCADLHLSLFPPLARTAEPDWLKAQERPFQQIIDFGRPVFCAGDIFHHWNSPAELINWAIKHLPYLLAIPGQHDLPFHNYEDKEKSAYWTLAAASRLLNLWPDVLYETDMTIQGCPWNQILPPAGVGPEHRSKIILVHDFIWQGDSTHPRSNPLQHVTQWSSVLKGYNVAVFGDNHKGFLSKAGGSCIVLNCGTLQRRRMDERGYRPAIGLLYEDGSVERHFLDVSADKFVEDKEVVELADIVLGSFMEELGQLNADPLDYADAVRAYLKHHTMNRRVERILLQSVEPHHG